MKKFIFYTSVYISCIFTCVISVNYFGDAANIFNAGYEKKIANGILNKKNVTNINNYNDRILQKLIIESLKICPEVIVIGSSRQMLINSSYFPNHTFHNFSVSAASLEDLIAIYSILQYKKLKPKKLILGIDPWTFNQNNEMERWIILKNEYNSFYFKLHKKYANNIENKSHSKYLQLISFSYFQSSIRTIFNSKEVIITNKRYNNSLTKLSDGSITDKIEDRQNDSNLSERGALSFINNKIFGLEKFQNISSTNCLTLELFLKKLKLENIDVTICLSPFHPTVFNHLKIKYSNVEKSEKIIKKLSHDLNIPIIGSFDPFITNVKKDDFYDGMHLNEKGSKKVFHF